MHREPEVLEAEAQVGKWLDCSARITSKELAPIHSVKNDILQSACSTRPRVVADLVKSARMHIVRLSNSLVKGLKKNGDKSAVAMLKKNEYHDRIGRDPLYTITHQTHDNWGCERRGYGAAEVFIDFTEELRHAETDPTCKIHKSCCTSRIHSRPKSFARTDLPR